MSRPCNHKTYVDGCRVCYWAHDRTEKGRAYRALWGEVVAPKHLSCYHLGGITDDTVTCQTCRGRVELKVRACAVHGRCTLAKKTPGVASCEGCVDCKPCAYSPVLRRSLAFFCYPVRGSVWRRSCDQIVKWRELFNGRVAVAVATGPNTESLNTVLKALGSCQDVAMEFSNDSSLREVVALPWLLEQMETRNPSEAFLLCHAKGATKPVDDGVSVHKWTDILWETLVGYWPVVEDILRERPVAGSFLKEGKGFNSVGNWHYSGSFCWIRSAELYRRNWRHHDRMWWGIESYPGLHFGLEEAGVVFHRGTVGGLGDVNLYNMRYIDDVVLPALKVWRREHDHKRVEV